jgi:hypothetical protein
LPFTLKNSIKLCQDKPRCFYQAGVGWLQSNNRRNVLAPLPAKKHHQVSIMTSREPISGCKAGTHVNLEERTEPSLTMMMLRCHEKSSFRACDSSFLSLRMMLHARSSILCQHSTNGIQLQTPARSISSRVRFNSKPQKRRLNPCGACVVHVLTQFESGETSLC